MHLHKFSPIKKVEHVVEEYTFAHNGPMIISLPDRYLVWDQELQNWRVNIFNTVAKTFQEVAPKEFCSLRGECQYCGSKMYVNDNLPFSQDKQVIDSFNEKHKHCGC